ncbi:MAG: hypothetical protein HQ538_03015 [Parcubacteria group bacterium]|nr:hypothetical protein [Parcubacteria group bacterium]
MKPELQEIIKKWTNSQSLDQKIVTLFEKVRDIPYGSIGSRDPLDVYKQNKGTCSGKHELLKVLYKELEIPVKDFIIMHRFKKLPVKFPNDVQEILDRTDIVDPHNFFKIQRDDVWFTVDITWDKALKKLEFPVTEKWDGKSDMEIAVALGGRIYETDDPITLKKKLISKLPEQTQKERKLFLKKLTSWLDYLRKENI